jgi:cobyrinic acid a,c-diamide synthase
VLGQSLTDLQGREWPMAGLLPHRTRMAVRLTLGYREAIAACSWGWLRAGRMVRGHEFHRSEQLPGTTHAPLFRWQARREGLVQGNVAATYLHHHWGDRAADLADWVGLLRKADEGI